MKGTQEEYFFTFNSHSRAGEFAKHTFLLKGNRSQKSMVSLFQIFKIEISYACKYPFNPDNY